MGRRCRISDTHYYPAPQHDSARTLLTKYSHEKTYRLREALAGPPTAPELPLQEIAAVESTIPDAPSAP